MLNPLPRSQWSETTAAHLLYRAGFGGCPEDVRRLTALGLDGSVSWLLDFDGTQDEAPAPVWAVEDPGYIERRKAMAQVTDLALKKEMARQEHLTEYKQMVDLRFWWVRRMALGPYPLREKMTLFWHGHFATSFEKVRLPDLLYKQNQIFRDYGLGQFYPLLSAVSKDPAMLIYLDGALSRKNHPNENFAREVMELFTLGEGHYTEKDIQESARAYAGWGLTRDRQNFQEHPFNVDRGMKQFLGQSGPFTGDDCLRIICQQEQTAKFLSWKLLRFFMLDHPSESQIDDLAEVLYQNNLDVKTGLRELFSSSNFYAPDIVRGQIKSPVEWLIGAVRELQGAMPTAPMALVMLGSLGQELFQPPNVKGWDGGAAWITTNTLLGRYNYAAALVEGENVQLPAMRNQMANMMHQLEDQGKLRIPPADVANLFTEDERATPDTLMGALAKRFLHSDPDPGRFAALQQFIAAKSPLSDAGLRQAIRLLMSTPDYQLC